MRFEPEYLGISGSAIDFHITITDKNNNITPNLGQEQIEKKKYLMKLTVIHDPNNELAEFEEYITLSSFLLTTRYFPENTSDRSRTLFETPL